MYRPPKRWQGVGGGYDVNIFQPNQNNFLLGNDATISSTNLDPSVYRYIGKFTLTAKNYGEPTQPSPNTLLCTLQYPIVSWDNVSEISIDITNVNGVNKYKDLMDGVNNVRFFVIRSRISDSLFRCIFPLNLINGTNILAMTIGTRLVPAGVPKFGEEYEMFWYDNTQPIFGTTVTSERVIAQMISSLSAQSTLVAKYSRDYSTVMDSVQFSSILSTSFITDTEKAYSNMSESTIRYSTTFQEYSTNMASYISSISSLSSAAVNMSSISSMIAFSTGMLSAELSIKKPELDELTGTFTTSVNRYNYYWSTFNALSTSLDVMNDVFSTFRNQTTPNALSSLNSMYPNLSTILLSMTGDAALYQKGGALLRDDQIFPSEFLGARISSFVQTMMDEQRLAHSLNEKRDPWIQRTREKNSRLSSISTVQVSAAQLLAASGTANDLATTYDVYLRSTNTNLYNYTQISTLDAKKMSLYSLGVDITKKTAELKKANSNIQIADNILSLINANLSDPYELYMDQIPKQYAPMVPNSEVPDPQWKQSMTIEIADPQTIWSRGAALTLWENYGGENPVPFFFTYEGKTFYGLFGANARVGEMGFPITLLMLDKDGTGDWTPATAAHIPMSADVPGLASSYYTYKPVFIELNSLVLKFSSDGVEFTEDSHTLFNKYGVNNPIYFTVGNPPTRLPELRLRFNAENAGFVEEFTDNIWQNTSLSMTASILLEPMVTSIVFQTQTALVKTNYYDILFKKFGDSSSVYFLYKDSSNVTRLFRLKFAAAATATTHDITVDQWLRTNTWGVPEIQFPIGQEVPIQLTIGVVTATEVEAQKAVFIGKRDTLNGELDDMITRKDALETEVGEDIGTLSSNTITIWSNWVTSTIKVEAKTFEVYQQHLQEVSSLYKSYILSSQQILSDAYIEEKRLSTFEAYNTGLQSSLSTYQSRVTEMYSVESALQSTLAALGETQSDVAKDQARCAEIRSLWGTYLADYTSLKAEYDKLTQRRADIAYSTGRTAVIASPALPEISTLSSFAEGACAVANQISDISYRVQMGGATPSTTTFPDTQTAIQMQLEALRQYAERSQLYQEYKRAQLKNEITNYQYVLLEISTQATQGIVSWRRQQITDPDLSTMTTSGLQAMRSLRVDMMNFVGAAENELAMREQYSELLAQYNDQQYRIKGRRANAMSAEQFRDLATSLDLATTTCNSYIRYRKTLFNDIQAKIYNASTMKYFPVDAMRPLYDTMTIQLEEGKSAQLKPRFPIPMTFDEIESRVVAFVPGGVLPTPLPPCATDLNGSIIPVGRPTSVEPTTTAPLACGVRARYVEFTNLPAGTFVGTQVLVIDAKGRNVAFGKTVSVEPLNLQFTTRTGPQLLTNGRAYSQELSNRIILVSQVFSGTGITMLRIDLGASTDITAVRFMKAAAPVFDSSQIRVSLKDEAYAEVVSKQLFVNTSPTVLDFRSALTSACAINVAPTRYGTCGTMARYVRILAPNPIPLNYTLALSQIVVVNSAGQNVALGRSVVTVTGGRVIFSPSNNSLTTGVYRARPQSESRIISLGVSSYLEIDLQTEHDVVAVHLHNMIGGTALQNVRVQLYTEDMFQAGNEEIIKGNRLRETVEFTYSGADRNCSTELRWPAYYGTAGIFATGIRLTKAPDLIFGTLKVIDRAGRNVVLLRDVEVNPEVPNPLKSAAVQEANSAAEIVTPFVSAAPNTNGNYVKIMFEGPLEICAIYILAPGAGKGTTLAGIRVELLNTNGVVVTDGTNTASFTVPFTQTEDQAFFDTRYIPDLSDFPITETAATKRLGQFGTYAQSLRIQPLPAPPARTRSDLMNTDLSANAIAYTLAFQSPIAIWKTADFPKLQGTFGTGPFYFSYNSAYYIAYLQVNQDDLTNGIQIRKYTGTGTTGTVEVTATEFPFSTTPSSPNPITVQILNPLMFTTSGWIASNIVLTDGTGKSVLPLMIRSYRIVFTTMAHEANFWYIWKEGDYDALVKAFGTEKRFEFIHNYTRFRLQLVQVETSQLRKTTFEVFQNNTWRAVTSAADFFAESGNNTARLVITADVFADGIAVGIEDTAAGKALQFNFNRPYEINSVLLHATEFAGTPRQVTLYDCGGKAVANVIAAPISESYLANSWLLADFRYRKVADEYSGPRIPYPIQYGPHTAGVLTRYVEILARDADTPLYISQIVAINSCGRNVAFQKDVYATSQAQGARPEAAVDGIFEDELTPDFAQTLIYDAYKPKEEAQSFVSDKGFETKLLIDLGRFVQKSYTFGNRDSVCENQVNNAACQVSAADQYTYNHEINCVIFIAPKGRAEEAEGVLVRLRDANGRVVGCQKVTRIVKLFGLDFLDFRRDTSRNLAQDLVERPQRSVKAIGCGILTTFVRVEQVPGSTEPIQLSQIFVIDITGKNVALYKPTRATDTSGSTFDLSFRAVDGKYYVKSEKDGYMSRAGPGKSFEVNLGCPTPVMKVYIVNLNTGNAERDERRLSNMRIKLYNESRDLIAVQTLTSSRAAASNPGGVRSLVLSKPGDARTISVAGVDMKARFFTKKYEENLIPAPPNIPPSVRYDELTLTTAGCDDSISVDTKPTYTLGPNRGIMAHFLRVYNPNSYIQISQALIFDGTGSCINRQLPLTNVFATNALPDRFPELAIDCCGGFFHVNRSDSQCYISERKPYEYWQVQVADTSAQEGREIIAIKYFPPKTNRLRNIGLRFQLLDRNQNVLSEYVFKEETGEYKANEAWVDFRVRGPDALEPLIQYCFPRLQTVVSSGMDSPIGIEQDSQGTVYVTDIVNGRVYTIPYTASSDLFGSPTTLFGTSTILGITFISQNRVYTLNMGVVTILNSPDSPIITIKLPSGFTGPAYDTVFDSARNILYVSYANGVASFNINLTNSTFTTGTFSRTNLNGPAGLVIRILNEIPYLYVAVKNEFRIRVYNLNTGQEDTTKTIGKGIMPMAPVTTLSETPTELLLKSPVGLALDAMNNLYFSDEGTDSIYVTAPDISAQNRSLVYRVAGTGMSGFSEDVSVPATRSMLQKPQNLIYHRASGDILFADMGNGRIRRIRTLSLNRRIIPQNPVVAPPFPTTTVPQGIADPEVPAEMPIVRTENRDRETLRELKGPARIETLD